MDDQKLPMLKPLPGELTVECPKCHRRVSETCCAYQEFDYYKNCYEYITRPGASQQSMPGPIYECPSCGTDLATDTHPPWCEKK